MPILKKKSLLGAQTATCPQPAKQSKTAPKNAAAVKDLAAAKIIAAKAVAAKAIAAKRLG